MRKIVIDPGHGGNDSGAVFEQKKEKNKVFDISKRLIKILEKDKYAAMLTRNQDYGPGLSKRSDIANIIDADIFVSIHINAFKDKKVNGIETFHFPDSEKGEELAGCLQPKLVDYMDMNDRGIKSRENLFVLKYTRMPAVLCEIGFISNDFDRAKLSKKEFRHLAAEAVYEGIQKYFKRSD